MKQKFSTNRGQASIVVIIMAAVIGFLFFSQSNFKKSQAPSPTTQACVTDPDPNVTVTFKGATYQRIFADADVMSREVQVDHIRQDDLQKTVLDGNGTEQKAYVPTGESTTWTPDSKNLLYVDASSRIDSLIPGFQHYDIYIKEGEAIPGYIKQYCNGNYPIAVRTLSTDSNGNYWPPLSFNADSLTDWTDGTASTGKTRPGTGQIFYLFAYEGEDTGNGQIATFWDGDKFWPHAKLTVTQSGETRTYQMRWVLGALGQMVLQDTDQSHPDHKIGYLYVTDNMRHIDDKLQFITPALTQPEDSKKNLQLYTFSLPKLPVWAWWSPECKPAIYLYPTAETRVHVTVKPEGYLTYTDPQYPGNGWDVLADPNGSIMSDGKTYPYLYYESKIRDDAIEKPTTGYLVSYQDLATLYTTILPELGLNAKETKEFTDYWNGKLPFAPYYFVGIMPESSVSRIEPLTITPHPDTIIRVRLYFEARNTLVPVTKPQILPKVRRGFTVVEWGGLVKADKSHPFTCSQ